MIRMREVSIQSGTDKQYGGEILPLDWSVNFSKIREHITKKNRGEGHKQVKPERPPKPIHVLEMLHSSVCNESLFIKKWLKQEG